MKPDSFTFIDLFAGIGGFHIAMQNLGGKCVFASEIDEHASFVYENNFGIKPKGDITKIDEKDVPNHNVLCAGFPCQSFSKAGNREGINDPRGTLFFDIVRIAKHHQPEYLLLENVRNLASHDNGNTWKVIKYNLEKIGYNIPDLPIIFSPHYIGIPQHIERVFILCKRKDLGEIQAFVFHKNKLPKSDIYSILDKDLDITDIEKYQLKDQELSLVEIWNEFFKISRSELPGFPIWTEYFKDDIDYEEVNVLPEWKKNFVHKNIKLYQSNKKLYDAWLEKAQNHPLFYGAKAKFEWQAGKNPEGDIWNTIMQFRPSGLRVKKPTYFPALVAITQTSIVGKLGRRITPREASRLQSFPDDYKLHPDNRKAYKQLGNAVNAKLAELFAAHLFGRMKIVNDIIFG
ncbi:MAG: DNA (cytosine-5-)-methyltransferase [Marinilabiliales bacterium]|nr:MAG: DNA (cytosine-5-)-methyltransferase [Marinilabiliales bacterium]